MRMSSDDAQYGSGSSAALDPSASQSQPGPDPMLGQVLDGRYRIISKLGEGGMGEVYAGEHIGINKRVAIKLLRAEIVTNKEAVSRFKQEARSASSIGHKNIIGIEDLATLPDGRIYLCMELLDGAPLNDLIEQPIETARLVNILIQTGHGLAAAHAKGIVHRDMKPENIFVTRAADGSDVPKLLDFGIAKVSGSDGNNHLTRTGTIFGTPFYMAPEQALGQPIDHRADIYAMGVIMYEVFCGDVPFQGESFMGILTQHITAEPKPPSQAAAEAGRPMPNGIEAIIVRAMKKDPDHRYATMDELVGDLVKVYRGLAGAGMSGYMQAHVPASQMLPAAHHPSAPHLFDSGPRSAPMQVPVAHTPTPTPQPVVAGDSFSDLHIPKKGSKVGVVLAILAVLAVVGGGAAFLIISSSGKDDGETAQTDTPDKGVGAGVQGTVGGGEQPDSTDGTVDDGEVQVVEFPRKDAGGDEPSGTDIAALQPIPVLVNSKPQGAEVYDDGGKIGRTPVLVKVIPGEPVTLRLEKGGYKDETLEIDGSTDRFDLELDRKHVSGGSSSKGGSSSSGGKGGQGGKTGGQGGTTDSGGQGGKPDTGGQGGKPDTGGQGGKPDTGGKPDADDKHDPNVLEDGVLGDPASELE